MLLQRTELSERTEGLFCGAGEGSREGECVYISSDQYYHVLRKGPIWVNVETVSLDNSGGSRKLIVGPCSTQRLRNTVLDFRHSSELKCKSL